MPTRFVSDTTTMLYRSDTGFKRTLKLIFGDEVDDSGTRSNRRAEVEYRGRPGWVKESELGDERSLEMYFIDVGQGDSTFIVTPRNKKILVDGGTGQEALKFLIWKYRLHEENAQQVDIDLLVLSHADEDHIAGLVDVIEHGKISVKKVIHSGIAKFSGGFDTRLGDRVTVGGEKLLVTRHSDVAQLANLAVTANTRRWRDSITNEPGVTCTAVDATTGLIDVGDPEVEIEVLGPRLKQIGPQGGSGYPWLGSEGKTVNGHSVVLRLIYRDVKVLLPGDINERGARYLFGDPQVEERANAHILKAPHHGSHEFHLPFLKAVKPQITAISSGETRDHGHPRANFLGTIGNVSRGPEPLVFSTELVALFNIDRQTSSAGSISDSDFMAMNATDAGMVVPARTQFKKRLNGIINVRTDGRKIYAARRVSAGYQWVAYGPIDPLPRD